MHNQCIINASSPRSSLWITDDWNERISHDFTIPSWGYLRSRSYPDWSGLPWWSWRFAPKLLVTVCTWPMSTKAAKVAGHTHRQVSLSQVIWTVTLLKSILSWFFRETSWYITTTKSFGTQIKRISSLQLYGVGDFNTYSQNVLKLTWVTRLHRTSQRCPAHGKAVSEFLGKNMLGFSDFLILFVDLDWCPKLIFRPTWQKWLLQLLEELGYAQATSW